MRWMVAKLKTGELNSSDIGDFFPVTWKKYLTETDQTDHIKARYIPFMLLNSPHFRTIK